MGTDSVVVRPTRRRARRRSTCSHTPATHRRTGSLTRLSTITGATASCWRATSCAPRRSGASRATPFRLPHLRHRRPHRRHRRHSRQSSRPPRHALPAATLAREQRAKPRKRSRAPSPLALGVIATDAVSIRTSQSLQRSAASVPCGVTTTESASSSAKARTTSRRRRRRSQRHRHRQSHSHRNHRLRRQLPRRRRHCHHLRRHRLRRRRRRRRRRQSRRRPRPRPRSAAPTPNIATKPGALAQAGTSARATAAPTPVVAVSVPWAPARDRPRRIPTSRPSTDGSHNSPRHQEQDRACSHLWHKVGAAAAMMTRGYTAKQESYEGAISP